MRRFTNCLLCILATIALAEQPATEAPAPVQKESATAKLAASIRDQVVLITYLDRDGAVGGQGTGFIVDADGLIATNLHVIGEARPIEVTFSDETTAKVLSVHASDRDLDLAILRVDRTNLIPFKLAARNALSVGDPLVVVGHPLGLTHSVVTGVLSARRELDGQAMLQLAVPIEPGNSGGPALDMDGVVHGIVTAKSTVTPNLGFAVEAAALQNLLVNPNPIPMSRWLTVGALDPNEWTPLLSGEWRQQPGRLTGSANRPSLTGRSICASTLVPPKLPYEISCEVQLHDESGAAGIAFSLDDANRHYAFYPTNGRMRLTQFNGPTVFTWKILHEIETPAYLLNNWNHLRVRVDETGIECFVNGNAIIKHDEKPIYGSTIGLVRFRNVAADFRRFKVGKTLPSGKIPPELIASIDEFVRDVSLEDLRKYHAAGALAGDSEIISHLLQQHAREAQARARALQSLSGRIRAHTVNKQIKELAKEDDADLDVIRIALLIAALDNPDVEVDANIAQLQKWRDELAKSALESADTRYQRLNEYFFRELGFHGSRTNYYDRANSRIDQVINDREGLPISLAILYTHLAEALNLQVDGVSLPGHFIVRVQLDKKDQRLVDLFDGGTELSKDAASQIVHDATGIQATDEDFVAASPREILSRSLRNLAGSAEGERDDASILNYLDALVTLNPANTQDQWLRAAWLARNGYREEAIQTLEALIEKSPEDLPRMLMMRSLLQKQ